MKYTRLGIIALSLALLASIFLPLEIKNDLKRGAEPSNTLVLRPPLFVSSIEAANSQIGSYLDTEAGISAYFQSPGGITLNTVRGQFRTIEIETANYIIGSVAVPNYSETDDVHVFVHTNGWVLAYYLIGDPASKIFDWKAYDGATITTNKLYNVLALIASTIGAPLSGVNYYDFRYPNATNMIAIADGKGGTDSFNVTIPSTYGYYERSWFASDTFNNGFVTLRLDGNQIGYLVHGGGIFGTISAGQMVPDIAHTIAVETSNTNQAMGGIFIVYRIVP